MLPIPRVILVFIIAFDLMVFGWIAYSALTFSGQLKTECVDESL